MNSVRRTNSLYFVIGFLLASFLFLLHSSFLADSRSQTKYMGQVARAVPFYVGGGVTNDALNSSRQATRLRFAPNGTTTNTNKSVEAHKHEQHDHDDEHSQNQGMFNHTHGESEVARTLRENVRIFCWIMAAKANSLTKAVHINATWAPRCNKYVFVTPEVSSGLPTLDFGVPEGRDHLWAKTKAAFQWIYENEVENYDWFLKADDDTYVIMENMRFMLLAHSPEEPVYFGCRFRPFTKQGYMSGGSGYVLSREAVRRLGRDALSDPEKCRQDGGGSEDVEIGRCLLNVNVTAGDSRDAKGRHRMLPFSPMSHLQASIGKMLPQWFYQYMYYPYDEGGECCSDYMISFHYVDKGTLYALDNLLYHIRPIGSRDELWYDHIEAVQEGQEGEEGGTSLLTALKKLSQNTSGEIWS